MRGTTTCYCRPWPRRVQLGLLAVETSKRPVKGLGPAEQVVDAASIPLHGRHPNFFGDARRPVCSN
ncbi:MAG: hypothetical protein U1D30_17140 [Planctomycetota bacterium]